MMWKLLFFVLLNGQPMLEIVDTNGLADCQAKLTQLVAIAEKEQVPLAARCVKIEIT